ncbi:MAG: TldD/PmbA family protein [Deltaproteobacteria bacterium]|nr:TldD/PmbA family protein [Deltaproteobacteria bacterium]MBI3296265.1 TldD/PmbA family protein [Deltaproteobacteria bacterium]
MSQPLEKEIDSLEKAAERLIDLALKGGADSAEVCASFARATRIGMEKQDFHLGSSESSYQVGLRVLIGDKQGFSSCNTLSADVLKATAQKAVEIGKVSPGNKYFKILGSTNVPKEAPVEELWDNALAELSLQTQKDWAQVLFTEATRDKRFRLNEASVSVAAGTSLLVNSLGTHRIESQTDAGWSVMGMAIDGENITSFDYFSRLARKAGKAPAEIQESVRQFRDGMVASLNHGPAHNYRGLVAFAPRALMDIFVSALDYHLNGRNVLEGTSRWKKSMIGSEVTATAFTLKDSPWDTGRTGATFFDREGTPTSPRVLIAQGQLEGLLLDNYSGLGLGLSTTGNASGGPATPPGVASHSLSLEGGTKPWTDLLRESAPAELLLVHRFSGQSDPVTGDFSGVAKGAQWLKGGEASHYVRETLISGNIFEVLRKCVGLSKEISVIDSNEASPHALLDGVSVTSSGK